MIKIYLSPSNQPHNTYCTGNTNEKVQMEKVAHKVKSILDSEYKCQTIMASLSMGIGENERPKEAQNKGCDIYIAIHSNAGGGGNATGAVAFYHPNNAKSKVFSSLAVEELNSICPIKSNRSSSVKNGMEPFNGAGYGEIRTPTKYGMVSALVETNFHDHTATANWMINNTDAIAKSYVNAIIKAFNIAKITSSPTTTAQKLYRVQVGAYAQKENAEVMKKQLKAAGLDAIIKYD